MSQKIYRVILLLLLLYFTSYWSLQCTLLLAIYSVLKPINRAENITIKVLLDNPFTSYLLIVQYCSV